MGSLLRLSAFVLGAVAMLAGTAHAQAWVGPKNHLSTTLDYSWNYSDQFVEEFSHRADEHQGEQVRSHVLVLGGEYTILDKWAVSAAVPLVAPRYTGDQITFPGHGRYDDGNRHYTFQDVTLQTRYQVLSGPLALAPHVSISVPMTDYATTGWAAAGRGLVSAQLGLSAGTYFLTGVPGLYLHGRYGFNLSERFKTEWEETAEFNQNTSVADLLVGYYVLDNLNIHLGANLGIAHGGFEVSEWDQYYVGESLSAVHLFHDPLLAEDYLLFGGGISYDIRYDLRVNAMYRHWTWGNNTRNANSISVGIGWDVF